LASSTPYDTVFWNKSYPDPDSDISIMNLRIDASANADGIAVDLSQTSHSVLRGLWIENCWLGIILKSCSESQIDLCVLRNCEYGISLWHSCTSNSVTANTIGNSRGIAINVTSYGTEYQPDSNKILGNSIDGGAYGISMSCCLRCDINGNTISRCNSSGILASGDAFDGYTTDNTIKGNSINDCGDGIVLMDYCQYNQIQHNTIRYDEGYIWNEGTARAGALTSIQLAVTASQVNDYYNTRMIRIVSGTGSGQDVQITDYVGLTQTATADFATAPNATSVYEVYQFPDYGIYIEDVTAVGNLVTNNDLYHSGATASLRDDGTGTITAAGNRL